MTLLAILIALAFEHFVGVSATLRSMAWFDWWADWAHDMFSDTSAAPGTERDITPHGTPRTTSKTDPLSASSSYVVRVYFKGF